MSKHPEIHLCIQQPPGYLHSLGFLDQARYFRYQFRRLGANVTVAKNRLRHDAVNFVFGAHLGFEADLRERHACIFVNLEQLGAGGAQVSNDYLKLLSQSAVVDYNADNRAAYAAALDDVPVVPLLFAPYLKPAQSLPLEDRPIDLLFFGSMNARRRMWLDRIEALGHTVAVFDAPLYGAERDHFIMQAKSVLNAHYYETSRFEQARVAHCLSLGTPVISELTSMTRPHAAFEHSVLWLHNDELEQFFSQDFGTPAYFHLARMALQRFETFDPVEAYAGLLAFAAGFVSTHHQRRPSNAWRPQGINVGSADQYRAGWLNVDVLESAQPDLLFDFTQPITLPVEGVCTTWGPIALAEESVRLICVQSVPAPGPQLKQLLANSIRLLAIGGLLQLDVHDPDVDRLTPDPAVVRQFQEQRWSALTQRFWELDRMADRFVVEQIHSLDQVAPGNALAQPGVTRVVLRKTETSVRERNAAYAMQAQIWLPEDAVDDGALYRAPAQETPVAAPTVHPVPRRASDSPPAAAAVAVRMESAGRTSWQRRMASVG